MNIIRVTAVAAALGLLLAGTSAQAQLYRYKDANGSMVFSDEPPPPGTPPQNILKAPKLNPTAPPPAADAKGADAKDKDKKKAGPKSVAEQEADYKKRKAEEEKKAKADADKAAAEKDREARCQTLQTNLSALQGGQRMKTFDANGNASFIDDNQRAAEVAKAQSDMASAKCN